MRIFILVSMLLVSCVFADNEHWRSYVEQKAHYLGHFGEMLRRKNDQYFSKREEYANWLVNYREMERENQHHHMESQDEHQEVSHEHAEVEREVHHEHKHHGAVMRRSLNKDPAYITATPNEALHFFKRKK